MQVTGALVSAWRSGGAKRPLPAPPLHHPYSPTPTKKAGFLCCPYNSKRDLSPIQISVGHCRLSQWSQGHMDPQL